MAQPVIDVTDLTGPDEVTPIPGLPVTETTNGLPIEVATNGIGLPVIYVDAGGLPVTTVGGE